MEEERAYNEMSHATSASAMLAHGHHRTRTLSSPVPPPLGVAGVLPPGSVPPHVTPPMGPSGVAPPHVTPPPPGALSAASTAPKFSVTPPGKRH